MRPERKGARPLRVLFVHGMGRTPVSGWPLLWQLRQRGLAPESFAYSTTIERFAGIQRRLIARISSLAAKGDYVLVGHSLGGVLLRAALASLPPNVRRPRRLFLLASPIRPSRLAQRLSSNLLYRAITGDCGQLLASVEDMGAIGPTEVPTTAIVGVRSLPWRPDPFAGELSDGVVAVSEASAEWLRDQVQIEAIHTVVPSSRRVGEIIADRACADWGYPPSP